MTAPALARAVDVVRRFGDFTATDRVSLRVDAGEVVGLLGANGAGKSTFMRLLLGLLRPDAGRIELLGGAPTRDARRRVGYVPQGLGLYEDLTVAENLSFAARAFAIAPATLDGDPELRAEARTLVRELPLGLRRRLAFVSALNHRPSLLVLDEPTSGVDPLARSRLWETVRRVADGGVGVLVSTHYMEEVEHCDRVVVLASGRVAVAGTARDIVAGRQAVEVVTAHWDRAFQVLDDAGLRVSLHGRALRLMQRDGGRAAAALRAAGTAAAMSTVPATFEEAFVDLVTAP